MSLQTTVSAERFHIGFFGRRNAGKSSLVNRITGQDISVVSGIPGTTTDPVAKAMELLPLGPVVLIDTPGFDDDGTLGELRVRKTRQTLNRIDAAVLVTDCNTGIGPYEQELLILFKDKKIPFLLVYNKIDLFPEHLIPAGNLAVSAKTGAGIWELKEALAHIAEKETKPKHLVGDLLHPEDTVILVTPIDSAAPRGRIILPQQQTLRDILDSGGIALVTKENTLVQTLSGLKRPPAMVITDSQVFGIVNQIIPNSIPLTSFSILMARYKGFLETAVQGVKAIAQLSNHDNVLIAEGCSHHRQCEDIGTVKLPRWLLEYTGKELCIRTCSGHDFPEDLSSFQLIIHCGGCMLTEREVRFRMKCAEDQGIPFTNYGTAIAHFHGILERSLSVFPHLC